MSTRLILTIAAAMLLVSVVVATVVVPSIANAQVTSGGGTGSNQETGIRANNNQPSEQVQQMTIMTDQQLQTRMNKMAAAQNLTIGSNLQLSHRWSKIMDMPSGSVQNLYALCNKGKFPIDGGYLLGSSNLKVIENHAFFNKTNSGWTVMLENSNNTSSAIPAAADVLCISPMMGGVSGQQQQLQTQQTRQPRQQQEQQQQQPPSEQNDGLTIRTDKNHYTKDQTITISGTVNERSWSRSGDRDN